MIETYTNINTEGKPINTTIMVLILDESKNEKIIVRKLIPIITSNILLILGIRWAVPKNSLLKLSELKVSKAIESATLTILKLGKFVQIY
jgi:hypothetical protein